MLIIFLILAAIFGIGGVIKGLLWAVLIGVLLLIAGIAFGAGSLGGRKGARAT